MKKIFIRPQIIKPLLLVVVLMSAMFCVMNLLKVQEREEPKVIVNERIIPCDEKNDVRRRAAEDILAVITELKSRNTDPRLIMRLHGIASQLDIRYALSMEENFGEVSESSEVVCPETFLGNMVGYPLFQEGFIVSPNCTVTNKKHIAELVTVVLNFISKTNNYENVITVLKRIKNVSKYLNIVVGVNMQIDMKQMERFINQSGIVNVLVIQFEESSYKFPGRIWNALIKEVPTPYVLLARDLSHYDLYARLERLVYVISTRDHVMVAGGSFRNSTGHWRAGCYQSDMKNYILNYIEGYKYSAFDCMFCDYLEGPFIADKRILTENRFDNMLGEDVIFHDWFIRIKINGSLTVNCPDAMYYIDEIKIIEKNSKELVRSSWLAFAQKWDLYRIIIPPSHAFTFSCKEVNLSCNAFKVVEHFLIPPCCFEQVIHALKSLKTFTETRQLKYELEAGSTLGAVKLNSYMPWDPDGDIMFESEKYWEFVNNSEWFSRKGLLLGKFQSPPEHSPKFNIYTPDIYIEMWGRKKLSRDFLPEDLREVPTKVNVLGVWVDSQANPALYSRNQYGPNYLKHSQWFLYIKNEKHVKEGKQLYDTAGSWSSCPKPFHHGCLDRYPGDGNIDFMPPNIV